MANINVLSVFIGKVDQAITISASGNVLQPYDLQVQNELSFLGGLEVLNATKLDDLLDGGTTTLHNHDDIYNTKSELSSTTDGSSGSTLVNGANKSYSYLSSFSTYSLQEFLDKIDAALAMGGSTSFADNVFRVVDNGDATKQIAFEASSIATGTTRTITMPNTNVNLGDIAANRSDIDDLRTLSGTSDGDTDLGSFTGSTIPDNVAVKPALQALETALESLPDPMEYKGNWAASTNTPTLADGVGNNGDVYYVTDAGSVDFGSGSISFAASDRVVYSGADSVWQKWDTTDAVLTVNGQVGTVVLSTSNISEGSNLYFTDERAQDAVGMILTDTATIDFTYNDGANQITADVKSASITATQLASDAVTTVKILDANVTTAKLADTSVTKAKLNSNVVAYGISQETDGSLSARGVFITATNNTGSSIAAGNWVRISASGEFSKAKADTYSNSKGTVGVLLATTADQAVGQIQVSGEATVLVAGGGNLTSGDPVWLSKATAGAVTQSNTSGEATVSGNTITLLGVASANGKMIISSPTVTEME